MATMLEKVFERKLGEWLKPLGILYYKFTSPAKRNVPDRIIIKPMRRCSQCGCSARVLFLELKREGNVPTTGQARELLRLTDAGAHADWTDNLKEAKEKINAL